MNDVQITFFLHVLRETKYFKTLGKELFSDKYVSNLYWLTKDFFERYGEIPFDLTNPTFDQLKEILLAEKKYYMIHSDLTPEKNMEAFLSNCQTIMSHDYARFNKTRVDENIRAWIDWETFQNRFIDASEYMKTKTVSAENVSEVIRQAQNIISGFHLSEDDDDLVMDFFDPETHRFDEDTSDNLSFGWTALEAMCNSTSHGIKNRNFTLFVGAPNIGKTIFLGNVAMSLCQAGFNTLFVSLEMEEYDMAHRLSANVFNLTMDEYGNHKDNMSPIIDQYLKLNGDRTKPLGKLWLKRMYAPTPNELHKLAMKVEKDTGEKVHALVFDYFTELGNDEGIKADNAFNTYKYHKTNAKSVFVNAGIGNYTAISAHQSSEISSEANDIFLNDLSESKGILHAPDNVLGIIQNTTMKQNKEYFVKSLKTRHSKYKDHYARLTINYEHMRLTCGSLLTLNEYNNSIGEITPHDEVLDIGSKA